MNHRKKKIGTAERIRRANEVRIVRHIRAMCQILGWKDWVSPDAQSEALRALRAVASQIEERRHR